MANDKLFHKNRARREEDLKRRKASREPYDRVLIVCEGLKTEPNYLGELIDDLKLNTANISVDGSCGSSPKSVLEHAEKFFQQEKKKGDSYDRIFCVFDKDSHGVHYDNTIEKIKNHSTKDIFQAINSIPCFEYFLLLHFEYTEKPYYPKQNKSVCDCVIQDLWTHIPQYAKANTGLYDLTKDKLQTAIGHCKRALDSAQKTATDNPTTQMHHLVEYLQNLKKQ